MQQLSSRELASQDQDGIHSRALYPAVRPKDIRSYRIPIAPLPEQKRIIAELEKQFTRLDAGVEALKRLQTHLKRYRASVLKAACEGKLVPTEAELARKESRDYEPADKLLKRILKERRAKWEADQLAKMKAAGKTPKDDQWKAKHKEPARIDECLATPLPEGWTWATIEQLASVQGGIQKQPSRAPKKNAFPFLRVANVLRGRLDLNDVHSIELFGDELARLRLERGDLLVVEGNGSASEIGRMAEWNAGIENCVHQNHIIRLRPSNGIIPRFLLFYWNSPQGRSRVVAEASSTSGLFTLSVRKISGLMVPFAPAAEQMRIIAEVERRLSLGEDLEALLSAAVRRAQRLRQSILKRAFEGKLVPQDPADEPASDLLERIRASAANRPGKAAKPRSPKTKTKTAAAI